MTIEDEKPDIEDRGQVVAVDLSPTNWRFDVVAVPDTAFYPQHRVFYPTFQITSPKGTQFSIISGGGGAGEAWTFSYHKNPIRFSFLCGKVRGVSQRDIGPHSKGDNHLIGPSSTLFVIANESVEALDQRAQAEIFAELVQFLGLFSRHVPRDAKSEGMVFNIDENEDFRRQWCGRLDQTLHRWFGELEPVKFVTIQVRSLGRKGRFSIGVTG